MKFRQVASAITLVVGLGGGIGAVAHAAPPEQTTTTTVPKRTGTKPICLFSGTDQYNTVQVKSDYVLGPKDIDGPCKPEFNTPPSTTVAPTTDAPTTTAGLVISGPAEIRPGAAEPSTAEQPSTTTSASEVSSTAPVAPRRSTGTTAPSLPATGSSNGRTALLAVLVLVLGAALISVSRRRVKS